MCRAHVEPVFAPRSAARRAGRPSEATYRRRRAGVGTLLAVLVAVGLVAAHDVLAGSGGVPASAAESLPAHVVVVARPGDTLWSIARRDQPDGDVRRLVGEIKRLNDIGSTLAVGVELVLP